MQQKSINHVQHTLLSTFWPKPHTNLMKARAEM